MTERQAHWAELVRGWRSSGQTAAEFAREHDVAESTLRWWARQFSKPEGERARGRPPTKDKPRAHGIRLARVVREGEVAPAAEDASVTVVVGAARVIVRSGVDEELLACVLRALGHGARQ
jgi:transposase-like protein